MTKNLSTSEGFTVALAAVVFGLSGADVRAEELPDMNLVSIRSVRAEGTGCQPGSVSSTLSPDAKIFSVLMDNYAVSAGGSNLRADKKTCDIKVEVGFPAGWQFSLFTADYRGFAAVDSGATAFHQVVYSFDGVSPRSDRGLVNRAPVNRIQASFNVREFRGPFNSEYTINNVLSDSMLAWSPCSSATTQTLKISTGLLARVLVATAGPRAQITLDSADGALDQKFGMKWRRCSATPGPVPVPQPPGPAPVPTSIPQPEPIGGTFDVIRASNGRDELMTTDASEAAALGYRVLMPVFKVASDPFGNMNVPLFRCINLQYSSHFLSRDSRCEGGRLEKVLGYVSGFQSQGMMMIARYVDKRNPAMRVTLPTVATGDKGNLRFEGVLGFALPSR